MSAQDRVRGQRHHERAVRHGVWVFRPPSDYPYDQRQSTAEDLGGHVWMFSQSIADVDPASLGRYAARPRRHLTSFEAIDGIGASGHRPKA